MTTRIPAPAPAVPRWWILGLVHFSVLAFALNLQLIPPILPKLVSDMGMTHARAGLLMGLFTLPGIFLAIPGGRVSDTIGPRSVALWSLALLTAGAFLMLPLHPGFLYAGRLCAGIGGAVLVVVAPQIVARNFHGRELGLAMGIFNTAVPLGTILAFNLLGLLSGKFGIPVVIMAAASFSLIMLVAFYLTYADAGPVLAPAPVPGGIEGPSGIGWGIWLVSIVWVLFNISILAYFTYSIDYFIVGGMAASWARFMSSLPMLLSIFLTPLVGLAMHRYGLRWSLPSVGCALAAAAIYFILTAGQLAILVWTVLLGVGISLVPPAVFTLAGEVVPAHKVGTGYGILTTVFNLGIFFGIPLIGQTRDLTQSYTMGFVIMSLVMGAGGAVAIISHRVLSN